jgi:uncharacterized protein (DUF2267 family)
MSANGLDVFDRTLQTTHIWLNEIMEVTGPDRQTAWHVLGSVLTVLRDRVPLELAAHLGAELPLLVRGIYYDHWKPGAQPERYRTLDEFLRGIVEHMGAMRSVDPGDAARSVFAVLSRHVSEGQVRKVRMALPEEIRNLWPDAMAADLMTDDPSDGAGPVTAQPERARHILT